jgi:hypothetical protein
MIEDRESSPTGVHDPDIERDAAARRSLIDELRQMIGEARIYAEAEAKYQKARVGYGARSIKSIIIYGALGAALVFFSLMALTLGLVLALTPLLSALGATAAVVLTLLLAAFVCAKLAMSRFSGMMLVMRGDKPDSSDREVDDVR